MLHQSIANTLEVRLESVEHNLTTLPDLAKIQARTADDTVGVLNFLSIRPVIQS